MTPRTLTTLLALLALTTTARADKFHFGDSTEEGKTEGNPVARVIEGVLVKEDKDTYTIRIVGGEMQVAKSTVKRVESDTLTVRMIETMEANLAEQVAQADTQRRELQAVEASSRIERIRESEAAAPVAQPMVITVDFQSLLPSYAFSGYDPVLHRANLPGLRMVIEDYLRAAQR